MSGERILLTGGAGYIGAVATRVLLAQGYRVRVLDTGWFGLQALEAVRGQIELVRQDMRTVEPDICRDVAAVIHTAGLSTDPMADFDPPASMRINADATAHVARCALRAGVRRFIYASSGAVYDRSIEEGDALQPEQRLLGLVSEGLEPFILRQGTVHGWSPRMRYDLVVHAFVRDALTTGTITVHAGGEQWRPMIHVLDMCEAYLACLRARWTPDVAVVNVFERNYRVLELAIRVREALRALEVPSDLRVDYTDAGRKQRSYRCAGERQRRLGICPQRTIEDGVRELAEHLGGQSLRQWYDPRGENMAWVRLLHEAREVANVY